MIAFIFNSILLGVGLAMDAFSISIVNGMNEPKMRRSKTVKIAGAFGFFQFAMPMIGWFCVHTISKYFVVVQQFIPWIAFLLLAYIGGKMLYEGLKHKKIGLEELEEEIASSRELKGMTLFIQGIATSIDALSVGFTIASYSVMKAFSASVLIAITTFFICMVGLIFGKRFGSKISDHATVVGGLILIFIGVEIIFEKFFL